MLKISSSSNSKNITNEQLVLLKHELEDNIIKFLSELKYFDLREIELLTARTMDLAEKEKDQPEKMTLMFKIGLLISYSKHRQKNDHHLSRVGHFLELLEEAKIVPQDLKLDEILSQAQIDALVVKYLK